MKLFNKNVVIYGAGKSGLAAYELVREKGAKAIIYDDNPYAPHATNSKGVVIAADIIVLSPGVDRDNELLRDAALDGKQIISELELASECSIAEQIAITGTNGKTTATMLIDSILKRGGFNSYAVGNIGTPFSALADNLEASDIAVIEASSFQLEGCKNFSPDIAVMLNILPDHLERHKTMENYVEAKAHIFLSQGEQDILVYNDDDEIIRSLLPRARAKKIPFSMTHPVKGGAYISSDFICFDGEPVLTVCESGMCAKELENVLAAVAVGITRGVSAFSTAAAITEFKRPSFRRERVGAVNGIAIYNDSKSTNISACLCACEAMDGDTVLILGGDKRAEDFSELFHNIPDKIKRVVASGANAEDIVSAAGGKFEIAIAGDIREALEIAFDEANKLGLRNILFSPASKSFDKFSDYKERGRFFETCACDIIKRG